MHTIFTFYIISNPDVEHHNSYAAFDINGEMKNCTVIFTTEPFRKPGDMFFDHMVTGLVPIDDLGTLYTKEDAANFAVPTTGGTGAESTINYVITDVEKKRKFVCVDPNDIPDVAVVDPDMMSSMPKGLTASTGMDALTHAIEGYTTKAA